MYCFRLWGNALLIADKMWREQSSGLVKKIYIYQWFDIKGKKKTWHISPPNWVLWLQCCCICWKGGKIKGYTSLHVLSYIEFQIGVVETKVFWGGFRNWGWRRLRCSFSSGIFINYFLQVCRGCIPFVFSSNKEWQSCCFSFFLLFSLSHTSAFLGVSEWCRAHRSWPHL